MSVSSICGVIITTENMEPMVEFYGAAIGLPLQREEHGEMDVHYGLDFGNRVHFALHPPADFQLEDAGHAAVKVAFTVDDLHAAIRRLAERGHRPFIEPHDEGFGPVAAFRDPDGNVLELVQLRYDWST